MNISRLFPHVWRAKARDVSANILLALVLLLAHSTLFSLDSVTVIPGIPVAYEANQLPGSFIFSRTGSTGSLTINYSIAGSANADADYTALVGAFSFAQGEVSKTINVIPVNDSIVEGRETVLVSITPNAQYIVGPSFSAQINISDDDLQAIFEIPDSTADEDSALFGYVNDPPNRRRAIIRTRFALAPSASGAFISRNLRVSISGAATIPEDYFLRYKICGNNSGNVYSATSKIGFDFSLTTGLGYSAVAGLAGETSLYIENGSEGLTAGASITIAGVAGTYTTTTTIGTSGTVGLNPPLIEDVLPGAAITVAGTGTVPTGFVATIRAGTGFMKVRSGVGGLYTGDVFQVPGDNSSFYVITNDVPSTSGTINFIRYAGGTHAGQLNQAITSEVVLTTLLTPTMVDGVTQVFISDLSTKVEFSLEPISDAKVEGRESATITLVADEDYAITNPTAASILIADRDSVANVVLGGNAGKPNTSGSFQVTLDKPLPINIDIPYSIDQTSTAVAGVDYVALPGSVNIPAGQTTAPILVSPLDTPANGLTTVTISLLGTLDYKLAGSGSASTNPSATVNIIDSLGTVRISADAPAQGIEDPVTPTNGQFTVSIIRNVGASGAVGVNYTITGNAAASRFQPLSGSVIIPDGSSTATITVVPVDNIVADGNQSVVITLQSGQGYALNSSGSSAQIIIVDNEPTVSVVRISDATKPSTPGSFLVSYPGVPSGTALNTAITIDVVLSGTAVGGVDYSSFSTVTIPANTTSVLVPVAPLATSDPANKVVTLTLSPGSAFTLGAASASLTIRGDTTPPTPPPSTPGVPGAPGDKPAAGSIGTSDSSGCGSGSGFAAIMLTAFAGVLSLRRRRH